MWYMATVELAPLIRDTHFSCKLDVIELAAPLNVRVVEFITIVGSNNIRIIDLYELGKS